VTLHRYWFVGSSEDRYGQGGLGVTAFSKEDARALLREVLPSLLAQTFSSWRQWTLEALETAEVVENIDVRLLDQGHVIPNMGLVIDRGVWWPKTAHLH
jgi:hypothetical protein